MQRSEISDNGNGKNGERTFPSARQLKTQTRNGIWAASATAAAADAAAAATAEVRRIWVYSWRMCASCSS